MSKIATKDVSAFPANDVAAGYSYILGSGSQPNIVNALFERLFNIVFALVVLPSAILLMFPFYLLYLLTERKNGYFLYKGVRLGKHKEEFVIYKIRSLKTSAEREIGGKLHSNDASVEVWYGRILRNSRIDEFPQLINILKGDMDFIGPRPVRPIIYETMFKSIPGFDKRFAVKPGLTGYSQFYTPHSAPKRLRVKLDNHFIRNNTSLSKKLLFILRTASKFASKFAHEIMHEASEMYNHKHRGKNPVNRRKYRRKKPTSDVDVFLQSSDPRVSRRFAQGRILNMDDSSMCVEIPAHIFEQKEDLFIKLSCKSKKKNRNKNVEVSFKGKVLAMRREAEKTGPQLIVNFDSISEFNSYMKDKYLMELDYAS
ncbi:MAG: hypothetical protein GF398_01845 [Chitinivibrionales bacterium]|nr:hypothetical protein [Chitinivibrionales bacterium]